MHNWVVGKEEKDRVSALHRGDAPLYAILCDELGIDPEDDIVYSRGRDLIEIVKMRSARPGTPSSQSKLDPLAEAARRETYTRQRMAREGVYD